MMRRPESGHRILCRSGCWVACLLTGLIGGCTEAPQQEFAIRETTRDLIPEARAAVETSLLTYFGTPTAAVAWERLPLKFGGAVGQVESVDGPKVVVQWDAGHAPTPAQSTSGSPVVWPGSGVRSGRVGAGDTVAAYDSEKRLLTLSAADPAPAVGDRVALNFGHTLQVGRVVYAKNCGHCHGTSGDGEGPTAKYLNPRPRDYRNGVMKFTSTATPARASREDLKRMIREGIPGTYMPSFLLMKDEETDAVIEYILYLSMRGELEKRLGDILKSDYALSEVQKTYDEKLTDYEAEKKAGENPDPPKTLEQLTKKATNDFADFLSAYIIGNLLQMAFRFWAFRRWVFPDQFARNPEKALESALTAGGIAEVFEDELEGGNVTLLKSWHNRRGKGPGRLGTSGSAQLGDSSEPRVSKTS